MRMLWLGVVVALVGCAPLDALTGKSSREAYERRQAVIHQPEVRVVEVVEVVGVEPAEVQIEPEPMAEPELAPQPQPYVEPYVEPCYAIFRVRTCGNDGEEIWL